MNQRDIQGATTDLTDLAISEHFEERAAIMEFDGGLTRKQAEHEARRALTEIYGDRLAMVQQGLNQNDDT